MELAGTDPSRSENDIPGDKSSKEGRTRSTKKYKPPPLRQVVILARERPTYGRGNKQSPKSRTKIVLFWPSFGPCFWNAPPVNGYRLLGHCYSARERFKQPSQGSMMVSFRNMARQPEWVALIWVLLKRFLKKHTKATKGLTNCSRSFREISHHIRNNTTEHRNHYEEVLERWNHDQIFRMSLEMGRSSTNSLAPAYNSL